VLLVCWDRWIAPEHGRGYDTGRLRLESLNPIMVGHLGFHCYCQFGRLLMLEASLSYKQIVNMAAGRVCIY
jgi:hypothetical protein